MLSHGTISEADVDLVRVSDDVDEIVEIVSSRTHTEAG
jgi:hypothetical protein